MRTANRLIENGQYVAGAGKLSEALVAAQAFGPDDLRLATTWTDLGWVDTALGRYHAAEHASERAMRIYERTDRKDEMYARAVGNLAAVYANWQQYGKAREMAQRALDIQTAVLPTDHPDLARGFALLAFVNVREKRYEDAERFQRKALAVLRKHPAGREREVALVLNSLAATLVGLKRNAEAEATLEEALALAEDRVGTEHLLTGELLASLGTLRLRCHQDAEAEQLLARSLAIYERTLDSEHPDMVPITLAYAEALRRLHRNREASRYEKRARDMQGSRSTEDGRQTVDARTIAAQQDR